MAINPISVSRVSHNLRSQVLLSQIRDNTTRMFDQQQRLATGNKLITPSDDPIDAAIALRLTQSLEQQDQLLKNLRYGEGFLDATDQAVSQLGELLNEAASLASENANSLTGAEQRAAAAQLVDGLIDQLVAVANTRYQDTYLFAGRRTTQLPFERTGEGVEYSGGADHMEIQIDPVQTAPINLHGADLFGAMSDGVQGWADLDPALTADTRLVDVAGANDRGIRLGSLRIEEVGGPGTALTVDLTGADTIGDVLDAINDAAAAAGTGITATTTGGSLRLTSGGGFAISCQEVGTGQTASDLGLLTAGPAASPVTGGDLEPRLTPRTPLTALNAGAGLALGSVLLGNGSVSKTVDLSAATTIEDVLNALNTAGVGVEASINADANGLNVQSRISGAELRIGENGGTTAEDLGIRSLHDATRLADMNGGTGVSTVSGADLRITDANGIAFEVDLSSAVTLGDVRTRIDAAAGAAGSTLTASLAPTGNGLRLSHPAPGAQNITVERANLSPAIDGLGLDVTGDTQTLTGRDPNPTEAHGIFTALLNLRDALLGDDGPGITRAGERLEAWRGETISWAGRIGARAQAMQGRVLRMEDAVAASRIMLSEAKDVDLAEAVTLFEQAQTALQANLMSGSHVLNLSLLDFLR